MQEPAHAIRSWHSHQPYAPVKLLITFGLGGGADSLSFANPKSSDAGWSTRSFAHTLDGSHAQGRALYSIMQRACESLMRVALMAVWLLLWCRGAGAEEVPVVGCRSEGQTGLRDAPAQVAQAPNVPPSAASKLAFYASSEIGVLAPRGWHCIGLSGSSGDELIVTPADPESGMKALLIAATGPSVIAQYIYGETSGRFTVAQIAARLFPVAHAFVEKIIAEGIEPESSFSKALLPGETLRRLSDTVVESHLPSLVLGPTDGVAILLPDHGMDVVQVLIKLPSELADLLPTISGWVEEQKARVLTTR